MKTKSVKLRMLIILQTLFKYSDAKHRLNSPKLNKFLSPYGLDCTSFAVSDSVRAFKEFGIDVRREGSWEKQGLWIETRPLSEEKLRQFSFAVSTNPYLNKEQANELLDALKPFVTVYQEPLLQSFVANGDREGVGQSVFDSYTAVYEAIRLNRRILFSVRRLRYNKETGEVFETQEHPVLFTPKCLYQTWRSVYAVGYNHNLGRVVAVDLRSMVNAHLSTKHTDPAAEKVQAILDSIDPKDYIPEDRQQIIYKGPVVIRCRGKYLEEVVQRFGLPTDPVAKDARSRCTYRRDNAEIWTDTMDWLARVPGRDVRIKGPEQLCKTVREYYIELSETLLDARLLDASSLTRRKGEEK